MVGVKRYKLESEGFDEHLIYCPTCEFPFESYNDYIEHRKNRECQDYGILALIKSKCKYIEQES